MNSDVQSARERVAELHAELARNGLVSWTMGNISERVADSELLVIKPTVSRTPPSPPNRWWSSTSTVTSSTETSHRRATPRLTPTCTGRWIGFTAWFGGDIPVGPFARIGGEEIGEGIVHTLKGSRSRAVLMRSHGVFTIGTDAREAVKSAVMCEDAARAVLLARSLGDLDRLGADDIDALHDRYQNVYGQS
jgi:L-ribulose-5-phosphate 4-epimerase